MTTTADDRSPAATGGSVADVIERLIGEFEDRLALHVIARAALGCRRDLDCSPTAALPELLERLARRRLLDVAAGAGPAGAVHVPGARPA